MCPGPNFSWSCQIWGQKFFPLFSTLDSISTVGEGGRGQRTGVRDPTFFCHAKFEVKNFSLYLPLWTLFPQGRGGVQDPTFFGHAKFEVKNFSLYLAPRPNFFWSCQIWGQKIFPLFSTLDSYFHSGREGGCPGPNFFWSCLIWGQKCFPLFNTLDSISTGMEGGGVQDPTFFGHVKFEVKIFSLYLVLWTLFLQVGGGGLGPNFFWSCQIWSQKFFPLFSALDSISTSAGRLGRGGRAGTQLFWSSQIWGQKVFPLFSTWDPSFVGHAKFEVKNFSLYLVQWTLFPQGGGPRPNFFWSCQIWGQKFFPLFSTLDSISASGGGEVQDPTFFGHAKF